MTDELANLDDYRDIPRTAEAAAAIVEREATDHSWRPISLIERAANPPEPPSIGGLLYPGKRTVLSGETESMKTWLALILCKAELDEGLTVGWVDLDAMGPAAMLERLRLLGVDDDAISERFLYFEPSESLDHDKLAELVEAVTTRAIRLFVIDAFNPILQLHAKDPNVTGDIEWFWRAIADPIANAGAAPVLLDHVVKNSENRGKYAYGSERKASGSIVHIGFRLLEPLTKGGRGRTLLSVHKDRPGYLPRPSIGRLVLESDGSSISYRLEPDELAGEEGRHTIYMQRVSEAIEKWSNGEPVSRKWIEENVDGKADVIRKATDELVEDGYLRRQVKGDRGALLHTKIRPYTPPAPGANATSSPHRPDLVPNLRSSPTSSLVPPLRGRGRGGDVVPDDVRARPVVHDDLLHDAPLIPIDQLYDTEPEPE